VRNAYRSKNVGLSLLSVRDPDLITLVWSLHAQTKSLFAQADQLRSEGFKWTEIAKALNDQGITTPRGKQWTGAHAHSLLKKGKIRRLRLGAEVETSLSHFELTFEATPSHRSHAV